MRNLKRNYNSYNKNSQADFTLLEIFSSASYKVRLRTSQVGFTIVELMIATAAFSIILLLATGAIVEVGKQYYKSLVQIKTQETARNISEEVSRTIQLANGEVKPVGTRTDQKCIGDTRYTYRLNEQIDAADPSLQNNLGIRVLNNCSSVVADNAGKELLGKNMQLLLFEVNPIGTSGEVYEVKIRIAYGSNDLLDIYEDEHTFKPGKSDVNLKEALCKSSDLGSNFCAVSQLDSFVKKRL